VTEGERLLKLAMEQLRTEANSTEVLVQALRLPSSTAKAVRIALEGKLDDRRGRPPVDDGVAIARIAAAVAGGVPLANALSAEARRSSSRSGRKFASERRRFDRKWEKWTKSRNFVQGAVP
jgi:hypothetical protein